MSKHERNIHFGRTWARRMGKTEALRRETQGLDVVRLPVGIGSSIPKVWPEIDGIPPRPIEDKELEKMLATLDFGAGAQPVG